jgi:hypothetical protein
MTAIAEQELTALADVVTTCNVVYLPQLGFFLRMPGAEAALISEEDRQSASLELTVSVGRKKLFV